MVPRYFNICSEQSFFQRTSVGSVMVVLCLLMAVVSDSAELTDQGIARRWEEIAIIRQTVARGYEAKAEYRERSQEGTVGEALDGAGDEKVLAFSTYKLASQNWASAGKAYESIGDGGKAQVALYNADTNLKAARRTLMEAIELHRRAVNQYQHPDSLDKKLVALEKIAANLEILMNLE